MRTGGPLILIRIPSRSRIQQGFTLLEMLLAATLTVVILGLLLTVLGGVLETWTATSARGEAYQEARSAIHLMTAELGGLMRPKEDAEFITTSIKTGAAEPEQGRALGFICYVSPDNQPAGSDQSDVGAVVYFLAPSPDVQHSPLTLYRRLIPSAEIYSRLQLPGTVFTDACTPASPHTEVVAQNVISFQVTLRDKDFKLLPAVLLPEQVPAHVEVKIEVTGSRAAQVFFDPTTPQTRKDQIALQDSRQFVFRQHLP